MDLAPLLDSLKHDEGLRLKPYRCTAGKLTIGYGRNIEDAGISPAEAEALLRNDVLRVCQELDKTLPWWRRMSEARQRALANMAFNLGMGGLLGFKNMLAALHDGDYERAAAEAQDSRWARQVGQRASRIIATLREG
jgi:lysozyme